jgi:hypothetical protein
VLELHSIGPSKIYHRIEKASLVVSDFDSWWTVCLSFDLVVVDDDTNSKLKDQTIEDELYVALCDLDDSDYECESIGGVE